MLKLFLQYLPSQSLFQDISRELGLDQETVTRARQLCQQIVRHYYEKLYESILLGEDSSVIEADEACFRRKYNRGRQLKRSSWVFGITERDGGFDRTLLIPVASRDKNTLGSLIKQFVSTKCTLLLTDQWKGYCRVKDLGYQHFTVNHSRNFVRPADNTQISAAQLKDNNQQTNNQQIRVYQKIKGHLIHTQSIENRWTHIKQRLKRLKGQRKNYLNDIFDSMFYLSNKDNLERKSLDILIDYINNYQQKQQQNNENLGFENLSIDETLDEDEDEDEEEEKDNIFEYDDDSSDQNEIL